MLSIRTRLATRMRAQMLFALAALMCAALITDAWADTRVRVSGPTNVVRVRYRWRFPPCPANQLHFGPTAAPYQAPTQVHSPQLDGCALPGVDLLAWTAQSGGADAAGNVSSYALVHGNSRAGGEALGTLAFRTDTTFASDSVLFRVTRSGTTVTLNNFAGEMRTNRPNTIGMFSIAVYPSEAAADADTISDNGTGAAFLGRVQLRSDGTLLHLRGFQPGDFTADLHNGSYRARPAVGLSKSITVPSADAAVIVVTSDPEGGSNPAGPLVPGASHAGLALLSLLMLGSGAWLVSRRGRVRVV